MIRRLLRPEGGYVLVTALIALAVMSILALATISRANALLRMSRQAVREEQALYMANAGVEFIYARLTAIPPETVEENREYHHTMQLDPNVTGSYTVTAAVVRPGFLEITATGTVTEGGRESARRVVTAELPFEQGGGQPPPPVLVMGNGSLTFKDNVDICGDIYVNGDLDLSNNVTVWAPPAHGICDSVLGSGKAVVTGKLTMKNNVEIQGGWCDGSNYGPNTPCKGQKPQVLSVSPPNFGDLWNSANVRYVQKAGDCGEKPNCYTFDSPLRLNGNQSYQNQLVYINGDVVVDKTLRVTGAVTFAVTGSVDLNADLLCAGGSTCNVSFVTQGKITMFNNVDVWATLVTTGDLEVKNNAAIHGSIRAASMDFMNNTKLYPTYLWPVGLPGNPQGNPGTGSGGTGTPHRGAFTRWSQ